MTEATAGAVPEPRIATRGWLARVPLYAWLLLLVLLPNLLLLVVGFLTTVGGRVALIPTFASYSRVLQSEGFWVLLWRTLSTSLAAALIAAAIAYPMAYYASRTLRRGQTLAIVLVIIPLWISLLMRVFAWRLILGERGILNSFLLWTGIIDTPSAALLYTPFSVFLTFVYVSIPFVFIAAYTAIEKIPLSLTEAAQDCGASPLRAFRTVIWPLSKPGLAIGISLAFLLAVGDYVTPSMVGGINGTMLGMVIASQFGMASNWPYGAALASVLIVFVGLILAVIMLASRVPGVLMGESAGAPPPPDTTGQSVIDRVKSWLAFALFCLPYVFLYAPLVVIAVYSFNEGTLQSFPMEGFSTRWYAELPDNAPMLEALGRSAVVGFLVLLISVAAGTGFAILLTLGRQQNAKLIEVLLAVPVAVPGVVLGLTLVLAFQLLQIPAGLPRLVLGHATFVMPIILMVVLTRLRRLDPSLVEASMDCGAGLWPTFRLVLLPLISGAVFGGALLGFTLSVDEVVVSLFLAGTYPTLPVWIWNQMRFGFTPSVNAILVCIGFASLILILVSQRLIGLTRNSTSP